MVTDPDSGRRTRLARRGLIVLAVVTSAALVLLLARLPTHHAWQHLVAVAATAGLLAACAGQTIDLADRDRLFSRIDGLVDGRSRDGRP